MILFAGLFGCGGAAPPAPTPASVVPLGAWHAAAGACVVPVRTFVDATLAPADATAMVAALAAWAAPIGLRMEPSQEVGVGAYGDPLDGAGLDRLPLGGVGLQLVLVPDLAAPDTVAARTLGTLQALALTPLAADLPIPPGLPPTILASRRTLHGHPDAGEVLGHELAHLLGEGHATDARSLMDPGRDAEPHPVSLAMAARLRRAACPDATGVPAGTSPG